MDMFTALAEPNRRSILAMLAANGQLSAGTIARKFRVSAPAVSQHLKILREARLIRMEKRAQQRLYEINPEAMRELEGWARRLAGQYERRFESLENIVKSEDAKASGIRRKKETQNGNSAKESKRIRGRKN